MKEVYNPFYAQAVSVFGDQKIVFEDLNYMHEIRYNVEDYLKNFEDEHTRKGFALGLRGGHGSGKTHVLNWVFNLCSTNKFNPPTILYAKADTNNFLELYRQLVSQENLDKDRIRDVIQLALNGFAARKLNRARITEGEGQNFSKKPDLYNKYRDRHEYDTKELLENLKNELFKLKIPKYLIRVLIKCFDPNTGDFAYNWLTSKPQSIKNIEMLGLGLSSSLGLMTGNGKSSDSIQGELNAINALETISALHKIANVPLIILVDQFEILVKSNQDRYENTNSLIKKFVEQSNRQKGLVLIAGNPEAWDSLKRDISPRFHKRKPIQIGNLNLDETEALLEAYSHDLTSKFSSRAIEIIHGLSAGIPREIIRISYQAFQSLQGDLNKADYESLLKNSQDSGSIDDLEILVLSMVNDVLKEYGNIIEGAQIQGNLKIDRILRIDNRNVVGLKVLKATDSVTEAALASLSNNMVRVIRKKWPQINLIFVTVGYSSEQVRSLISRHNHIINYSELRFKDELNSTLLDFDFNQTNIDLRYKAEDDLDDELDRVSNELEVIKDERRLTQDVIENRFKERTKVLSSTQEQERSAQTSWEMLERLDTLIDSLDLEQKSLWNIQNNLEREEKRYEDTLKQHESLILDQRQKIRYLLVANEKHTKNERFDELGAVFLELLSLGGVGDRLIRTKKRLALALRRSLRKKNGIDRILSSPLRFFFLFVLAPAIMYVSLGYLEFSKQKTFMQEKDLSFYGHPYESFDILYVYNELQPIIFYLICATTIISLYKYYNIKKWSILAWRHRRM